MVCIYCNVKDANQKGRSFTSLLVFKNDYSTLYIKNKTEKKNTLQI